MLQDKIQQEFITLLQCERRVLKKQGKLLNMTTKRYYIIENEHLIYFKTLHCQKPKGVLNLFQSQCKLFSANFKSIGQNKPCIEIITKNKKTLIIFPKQANELENLYQHVQLISQVGIILLLNQNKYFVKEILLIPDNTLTNIKDNSKDVLNRNQNIIYQQSLFNQITQKDINSSQFCEQSDINEEQIIQDIPNFKINQGQKMQNYNVEDFEQNLISEEQPEFYNQTFFLIKNNDSQITNRQQVRNISIKQSARSLNQSFNMYYTERNSRNIFDQKKKNNSDLIQLNNTFYQDKNQENIEEICQSITYRNDSPEKPSNKALNDFCKIIGNGQKQRCKNIGKIIQIENTEPDLQIEEDFEEGNLCIPNQKNIIRQKQLLQYHNQEPNIQQFILSPQKNKLKDDFNDQLINNYGQSNNQQQNSNIKLSNMQNQENSIQKDQQIKQNIKVQPFMEQLENNIKQNDQQQKSPINCQLLVQECLWNFQFEKANTLFLIYQSNDINFQQFQIEESLLKLIITGGQRYVVNAENSLQKLIQQLENDQNLFSKENIDNLLIFSESCLMKGMMSAIRNKKFAAFNYFCKGWRAFGKCKQHLKIKDIKSLDSQKMITFISQNSQSRLYFIEGIINIGLSIIPNYFLKILSLIGLEANKQLGIFCLKKCVEKQGLRSNYSGLLLCMEYIELNYNYVSARSIIKELSLRQPNSPIFSWMQALLSWKQSKVQILIQLITKFQTQEAILKLNYSLNLLEQQLKKQVIPYYLLYEKAWFLTSILQWDAAENQFFLIISNLADLSNIDFKILKGIFNKYQLKELQYNLMIQNLQQLTDNKIYENLIIFPHICSLNMVFAAIKNYQQQNQLCEIYLILVQYIFKKFNDGKSYLDEQLNLYSDLLLKRQKKALVHFEILYFLKEINKLSKQSLVKMKNDSLNYLNQLMKGEQCLKKLLQNNSSNKQDLIEICSCLFLIIIESSINDNQSLTLEYGNYQILLQEQIPNESSYLLHHSFHWVAQSYLKQKLYQDALKFLKLSNKFMNSPFNFENKNFKQINEIKTLLNK